MSSYLSTSELAAELGVSRQTLSAVLNGTWKERRISRETFERISRAVAERGFVPQQSARALRASPRGLTGVVYYGDLFSHILSAVEQLNRHFNRTRQPVKMVLGARAGLKEALRELLSERVESIVIINARTSLAEEMQGEALDAYFGRVPTIVYNYPFGLFEGGAFEKRLRGKGVHLVGFSRLAVYGELMEKIARARRVRRLLVEANTLAYLRADARTAKLLGRFEGVLPYHSPGATPEEPDEFAVGRALAAPIAATVRREDIGVIVADADMQAEGLIAGLAEEGIAVPGDVGVIGFDDIQAAPYFRVPLTTIHVPVRAMVSRLIALLENGVTGEKGKACHARAKVVWRESFRG